MNRVYYVDVGDSDIACSVAFFNRDIHVGLVRRTPPLRSLRRAFWSTCIDG